MAKPSDLPAPKDKKSGLTLGATVGIAIAVALLVIGGALIAWIVVRRRRRSWGKKRKEQKDPESVGDSPEDEIAKKVEAEKPPTKSNSLNKEFGGTDEKHKHMSEDVAEIDSGQVIRAEMAGGDVGKTEYEKSRPLSELHAENIVHELPVTTTSPVEIGGGAFVAELDATDLPIKRETIPESTIPVPQQTANRGIGVKDEEIPPQANVKEIAETKI